MAARPPALLGVTFIRSGIRANATVKNALKSLDLTTMHKRIVVKNTPAVAGMLRRVIKHIAVQPVRFAPGVTNIGPNTFVGHDFVVRERKDSSKLQ